MERGQIMLWRKAKKRERRESSYGYFTAGFWLVLGNTRSSLWWAISITDRFIVWLSNLSIGVSCLTFFCSLRLRHTQQIFFVIEAMIMCCLLCHCGVDRIIVKVSINFIINYFITTSNYYDVILWQFYMMLNSKKFCTNMFSWRYFYFI